MSVDGESEKPNAVRNPVVLLRRLDESEISRHKRPSNFESESQSKDMEEEDDFPELFNFSRPSSKGEVKRDHGATLDNIFNSQSQVALAEAAKNRALEEELKALIAAKDVKELKCQGTWLQTNAVMVKKVDSLVSNKPDAIPNIHPGQLVFDLKCVGKLYPIDKLTFKEMPEIKTEFDKFLQRKSCEQVKQLLYGQMLLLQFQNVTSKEYLVKLLFHLLSTASDYHLVFKCKETLLALFKVNGDLTGYIGIEEILENLINMGVNSEVLSSVIELANKDLDTWCTPLLSQSKEKSTSDGCHVFPTHCLDSMLSVICACLVPSGLSRSTTELSAMVVVLSYISLDVHLRTSPSICEIRRCLSNILNKYDEPTWGAEINGLALRLVSLSSHHHNCLFIVKLFSLSVRSAQLSRVLSYLMLHKLSEIPLPGEHFDDVTPDMILNWTKSNPLINYSDYYCLQNAIWFLDFSVNADSYRKYGQTLLELSYFVKKLDSGIRESIDCYDATKIKGILARLYLKWSTYAKMVPMHQRTMFGYLKPANKDSVDNVGDENGLSMEEIATSVVDIINDEHVESSEEAASNDGLSVSNNIDNGYEDDGKSSYLTMTKCLRL